MENQDIVGYEEESKAAARGPAPNPYVIPAAIIVAGALIAGAVLYVNQSGRTPPQAESAAAIQAVNPPAAAAQNLADDDPFLGNPDAPVTLVEFGDFQCPFCGRFFKTTEQEIIEKYVKTGKARLVYRDFPLTSIHEEAQKSAEASECADEQGKFWEYHDLLYNRQNNLSVKNYKAWAGELGLTTAQFNACLDSGKYASEVQKDFQDGQSAGVRGTPGTFVNGRLVEGALPFTQFQTIIEEELRKAQ